MSKSIGNPNRDRSSDGNISESSGNRNHDHSSSDESISAEKKEEGT